MCKGTSGNIGLAKWGLTAFYHLLSVIVNQLEFGKYDINFVLFIFLFNLTSKLKHILFMLPHYPYIQRPCLSAYIALV